MLKVIITSGVPGAGKSTYLKNNYPEAFEKAYCSADSFFIKDGVYQFDSQKLGAAHKQCLNKFVKLVVQQEELILVDNTSTTIEEIIPYYRVANAFGYHVVLVTLQRSLDECVVENIHGVGENVIKRSAARITQRKIPKQWNNFEEIII